MNLSKLSIHHPVTAIMMVFIIVLVGFVSLSGMPMDLLPEIELPVAIAYVDYPNASPEEVESMVTKPLEQALASVQDLDSLSSMTSEGISIIMVQFDMGADMDFATLDMREKISIIESYLPESASKPMVFKMSMDFTPVVQMYISSDKPLSELNREVEDSILSYVKRSPGVASAESFGGIGEEVSISFDQEKLAGYGLTLSSVKQLIAAENINMPSGEVSKGETKVIVRTLGEFSSVDDIKKLPITLSDRSVIRLSDLAMIEHGYQDQTSISRVDGINSIGINITKQSTANTVDVSDEIQKTIKELEEKYPDLTFTVGFDQADYIRSSVSSVSASALEGGVLAILVIFLFLRSMSSTMIIAISIPTSFLATFALMKLTGMTLNLITLCALTLAVGMLVDDSIVVLENIFRVSREEGVASAREAATIGSKQITLAVTASTLTSVVVYLPIALSGGIAGMLFADFCWTFIISLLASLIVSLTVVPMLCSRLLDHGASLDYVRIGKYHYRYRLIPYFTRFLEAINRYYEKSIVRALKNRKKVLAFCLILFIISAALLAVVGMEFMPSSDEAMFTVNVDMPYGTSLENKAELMAKLENYVLTIPELKHCTADIGLTSSFMGGETSSLSVTLVPKQDRKRSVTEIIDEAKKHFESISGAEISFEESSFMTGLMGDADMSITIKGPELDVLQNIANDLGEQISTVPGVADATTSVVEGTPEVQVVLDRNTAAFYGITAYQLASDLESSLSGSTATTLKIDGKEIDVNLSLSDTYQNSVDNMQQILVRTASGGTVPVGQVADLRFDNSPSRIDRADQQRYVNVNIRTADSDLAAVSDRVFALLDAYQFPDGYEYEDGGLYEQMVEAFGDLLLALVVAVLLVYMVLAAQFESLTQPLIVMMAIPFAMSGAFLALFITGKTLSITSFLGLIMLVGIVVKNSILLIEFITQNKDSMDRDEAIVMAGRYRLRPILMTTMTTCVGMIPLSLGFGDGGEILSPLGVSIIGGLIGSTAITLILIPVLYAMTDDNKQKRLRKKEVRLEEIRKLEEKWDNE
ncbi:MAG: efflux RND transporter permease subunit [Eubacteriales bacterium]|nr:efflux RND transporter permease subunit [Eubacteriales bacterium]